MIHKAVQMKTHVVIQLLQKLGTKVKKLLQFSDGTIESQNTHDKNVHIHNISYSVYMFMYCTVRVQTTVSLPTCTISWTNVTIHSPKRKKIKTMEVLIEGSISPGG